MKTENEVLIKEAKNILYEKFVLAVSGFVAWCFVLVTSLFVFIYGGTILFLWFFKPENVLVGIALMLFCALVYAAIVLPPMIVGLSYFYLPLSRNQEAKLSYLFRGFKRFLVISKASILKRFTFLPPSTSQTFFILADSDSVGSLEAVNESKRIMDNSKWKYTQLNQSFIIWVPLCILTLGIGVFLLVPYIMITRAKFYDDIKDDNISLTGGGQTSTQSTAPQLSMN